MHGAPGSTDERNDEAPTTHDGETAAGGTGHPEATPTDGRIDVDWRRLATGLAGTLAFLVVWAAAASTQPSYLMPSPTAVTAAFLAELESGRMLASLGQSAIHYVPGVVLGTSLGTGLGITMAWYRPVDDLFRPVVRILRPIPPIAWIAVAIVWVGIGHAGATFVVAVGTFWISYYNAYAGVEGVPQEQLDAAAVLVANDRTVLRSVVLPNATPAILTGVRTSVGRGWMTVVAAELFGAPGVGYEIITSAQNLALAVTMSYMLLISGVFIAMDGTFRWLQRRLVRRRRW
ncbi:ABC transporter permease [Halopiger goleimassiliensis]|uniref:ABC transporter permease n=1 Tax=Halopiger goleimassiliensis TaxID=1293048 RepID=UPI0009DBB864|nr:ABC transporter permease [Halopiger goleimassiliensis]